MLFVSSDNLEIINFKVTHSQNLDETNKTNSDPLLTLEEKWVAET